MRITDSEDDYTVTADQRAALMELETLTWNYPTPQQGGRGRGTTINGSSFPSDDQTDTDDDDDDDSYYVDMVPYDIGERLKEINRAFIEDPTPAECNRAITVRFRDVIADYQSPREYYPSDSDDGYGDSSDLVYDAEDDECGLTSLTSEVRDILSDNVNVIDFLPQSGEDNIFANYLNLTNGSFSEDASTKDYRNLGLKSSQSAESEKASQGEKKTDVPRLQLNGKPDDSVVVPSDDKFSSIAGAQKVGDFNLLKVDDSGLADLESFMKDNETDEIDEDLPKDPSSMDSEGGAVGCVSLLTEPSDQIPLDKGFTSLDAIESRSLGTKGSVSESDSSAFFQKKEPKDIFKASSGSQHLPAKSDTVFSNYEYDDDFEEFPDDEENVEESKPVSKEEERQPQASSLNTSSVETAADPGLKGGLNSPKKSVEHNSERKSSQGQGKGSPQSNGHKSRLEQSKKTPQSPTTDRKKRPESKSPVQTPEAAPSPARPKLKRVAAGPPTIKPALLSSDKIGHMKNSSDTNKYKPRNSTLTRSTTSASTPSLSSSSSSASSSPSSSSLPSSSALAYSSPSSSRGRSRKPITGPVRPTQHKPSHSGPVSNSNPRGVSRSPVRTSTSPTNGGLAVSPSRKSPTTTASGRPSPPYRVRKAASASDLHRMTEEPEDRKRQSDAVFKAWLQQKNKQAAIAKKNHISSPTDRQRKTSTGRGPSEVVERRARAEEAFQAWLARKREQLRLEKRLRGDRRRLEDQSRYARTKAECEVAYKEWCRRKRDEVRTMRPGGVVPRSQSLERPWVQEKTRKLYSAYMNGH
ncbi:nucleolar and coiled-body phosphoprotein 1-like isoform X2 [Palaemon carinicauda]|uniref:nucleolar and coiled-body phosphoprotein 1-like isoform X2 n=1 Tax=Palaemon carinicauda TaxID=392227 RepID=UPI0035B5FDFC